MRSGNPALRPELFKNVRSFGAEEKMSIEGAVNKTFILLFLTGCGSFWVWSKPEVFLPYLFLCVIAGLVIAFLTIFKKEWSPITAPVYAFVEGIILGVISSFMERAYPGIVIQAVFLTFGTLFSLLTAYKSGLIKVTENFRLGVFAATGGICLVYFASIILGFFGVQIPFIHEGGLIGIGFSLFVVVIAALNLVLDFDFIQKSAEYGLPKYMEWYGAFGLIVTLIWLYLEILRLLAKMRER